MTLRFCLASVSENFYTIEKNSSNLYRVISWSKGPANRIIQADFSLQVPQSFLQAFVSKIKIYNEVMVIIPQIYDYIWLNLFGKSSQLRNFVIFSIFGILDG